MNRAATIYKPSRADVFIGQVLPPDRLHDVVSSMPAHVKPERFQRNLVTAITQHPRLLECDPIQVFNEVSKAAALGLYLDPQLGEAYLITGFSNGRYVPQLRLGYRGLIKLARQSGEVSDVYAHDVCANDKFKMTLGTDKAIYHEPDYQTDRGEIGLYYAVVKFSNGATDFEPMSIKEIHRIRDRSDGWKAFKAGKIKSTPWATDEGEMSKKTVLRRLLKRMPQSPELADALRIEDAEYSDPPNLPQRPTLASRLAPAIGKRDGFSLEHVQIETSAADAHSQPDRMENMAGPSNGGDHVTASTLPDHAGSDPGAETGQAGERPAPVSNSSQPLPPVDAETDKPASEPNPSALGAGTNPESSGGSLTDDGEQAGADQDKPGAGLPPGWQAIYVKAMNAASDRPKSLQSRHTEALKTIGGEPSEADLEEMRAIYALRQRNLKGEISAEDYKAMLREIVGDVAP